MADTGSVTPILAAERRLGLRNCFDFRDLGGYEAHGGWRTRHHRLYRSDGIHRLDPADRAVVAELGLATIIDLRTAEEVARQGTPSLPVVRHHLPMGDHLAASAGAFAAEVDPEAVATRWRAMLDAAVDTVREVLAILTDRSAYPALVCCPSGVDRTGVVTAVVLGLVGVPDSVVVRDFAASRQAVVRRLGRLYFEHPAALEADPDRFGNAPRGLVPEAMASFCRRIRDEHGSFAGYADSIDMAGAVAYLRAALLERSG